MQQQDEEYELRSGNNASPNKATLPMINKGEKSI
jgi:hypothetical protein